MSNLALAHDSQQRQTLAPRTIQEALDFSSYLAKSELIPRDYQNKPHNIFVAVQFGMELGLQPMQALNSIAVVNGRPSMWGDAVLAVVMSHRDYEWHKESIEGEGDNRIGVFIIKRRNLEPHEQRFSVEDARKAGLWGKGGPWTQHASRMLKLRARGFALRDIFPDALRGIISREEAQDYPEPRNVTPVREDIDQSTYGNEQRPDLDAKMAAQVQKITHAQAKAFSEAWKARGYSVDEAKAWLGENLGLTSSLAIPADSYEHAMDWARVPKKVREMGELLGVVDFYAELAKHGGDWAAVEAEMEHELAEGNADENA